jgi:ATP-dependent helicase/nuclease subunit A
MTAPQQQAFRFATATPPPPAPRRRNLVIEAGAGTGKTTAIVAEVLRLLLGDEELNPERIVLVTFTEKAAGEIADRIHSALTEIDLELEAGGAGSWPIGSSQPLFQVPDGERDAYRRACAKQLARIDRLESQTIHAFCPGLLRQHAIEAGLDPQFRIMEGFERAKFYSDVYDSWIDRETRVHPTPEVVREWEVLLEHAGYLFLARNMIFALLDRRDLLLDTTYTVGDMSELEDELMEALKILKTSTADTPIVRYVRANAAPKSGSDIDAWIEYFKAIAPAIRSEKLRNDGTKAAMKVLRCGDDIGNSIYDVLVSHRAAVALLSLTRRFIDRADAEKRARSVADFDDLLIQTMTLLENEQVLERVRQQFDFIFVDEFQDTDRLQARIIDRLGRDAKGQYVPGKTIVVGDPKQSIYGFRRADPELYATMTSRLIDGGADQRILQAQYRSEPALLDAINVIARKVLDGGERDPNVFRPPFHPLVAARETEHADDASITVLACEAPEGESRFTREAEAIADRIAGAPDYRRYAILFRRMTQIDAYLDVFDSRGIPYVLPPTRQFLARPAPVDLVAVLRAIGYPTDRGAEISAARTPYFALTDSEIVARGDVWNQFAGEINALRTDARHLTITALIDRIIGATDIEAVYATCADGGRSLRHLEHLRAIAFAYDQTAGGSARQFVDEIARRREEPDEVEPALFDETKNAVRILTIHGAKGLEFETVILPDLQLQSRGIEIMTVDEPRSLVMHGKVDTICAYSRKSGDRLLRQIGSLREDAEGRRLFYVAITRARRDVVFVTMPGAHKKGFSKFLQEAIPFDASCWPGIRSIDGINVAFTRPEPKGDVRSKSRISVAVPQEIAPRGALDFGVEERRFIVDRSAARQGGILLHRVLERWDGSPDLLPRIAREQGADDATTARVEQRLATVRKSATFQRIEKAQTVGREMPVSFIDPSGMIVEKRLDRVIREADGETVIDYKSGEPSPERVAVDREQVGLYRSAMERLTGRPHRGLLWYIDDERDVAIDLQ